MQCTFFFIAVSANHGLLFLHITSMVCALLIFLFGANLQGVILFCRFKEKQYGSSGATSGLSSSLAFTPVQVYFHFHDSLLYTDR